MVVELPSNYNAILGRPILHELKAAMSIYHYCIKFASPYGTEIVQRDQPKAGAYNVDLPKSQVNMLNDKQDARAKEARLKRPIIADLSKIGITERHLKNLQMIRNPSTKKRLTPIPYSRVLIVIIPKVLVDVGSAINIFFANTFKWMGIPANFL